MITVFCTCMSNTEAIHWITIYLITEVIRGPVYGFTSKRLPKCLMIIPNNFPDHTSMH